MSWATSVEFEHAVAQLRDEGCVVGLSGRGGEQVVQFVRVGMQVVQLDAGALTDRCLVPFDVEVVLVADRLVRGDLLAEQHDEQREVQRGRKLGADAVGASGRGC